MDDLEDKLNWLRRFLHDCIDKRIDKLHEMCKELEENNREWHDVKRKESQE